MVLILAGGRSSRLGGVPKAALRHGGTTLLQRTVTAALDALAEDGSGAGEPPYPVAGGTQARVAVVGPVSDLGALLGDTEGVLLVQEDPPFAGPAAGVAAGLDALGAVGGQVLVLACDMPGVADVLRPLMAAAGPGDAVIAVDGDRRQPLAAIYPVAPLLAAVADARAAHRLENASVFSLIASLNLKECVVPHGSTADIDTWDDARRHGIEETGRPATKGSTMEETDAVLEAWLGKLLAAFEISDIDVDTHAVLGLAGVAAHSIVRPAAPLTTFVAGLAAGLAAGSGQTTEATAMKAALGLAKQLAAAEAPQAPAEA